MKAWPGSGGGESLLPSAEQSAFGDTQALLRRWAEFNRKPTVVTKGRWDSGFTARRLREFELIIRSRHGGPVIDSDDGWSYLDPGLHIAVGHVLAVRAEREGLVEADFVARLAAQHAHHLLPLVPYGAVVAAARLASEAPRRWRADDLATALGVKFAERQRLGLTTIGCCDLSRAERQTAVKAERATRAAQAKARQRRAKGVQPRAEYLENSVAAQIRASGQSRRTWYRHRQREGGTGPAHP